MCRNGYVDVDEFQHVWADDVKYWPFILADIEYTAKEVFTMVGPDGKLVEGSEEPRDRKLNLVFRGNLWKGNKFDCKLEPALS